MTGASFFYAFESDAAAVAAMPTHVAVRDGVLAPVRSTIAVVSTDGVWLTQPQGSLDAATGEWVQTDAGERSPPVVVLSAVEIEGAGQFEVVPAGHAGFAGV